MHTKHVKENLRKKEMSRNLQLMSPLKQTNSLPTDIKVCVVDVTEFSDWFQYKLSTPSVYEIGRSSKNIFIKFTRKQTHVVLDDYSFEDKIIF